MHVKVIEWGDFQVTVRTRGSAEPARTYNSKTRVYVSDEVSDALGGDKLAELQKAVESLGDRRGAKRGLFPEVDRLYDTLNREIGKAKRTVVKNVAEQVLGLKDVSANFSRHAGCSCPCSPGVILGTVLRHRGAPADVWVSAKS